MDEQHQQSFPADRDRTKAFVRLLSQHERSLNAYILALVPHWADAEEIAQETKVRLWEQFEQFEQFDQADPSVGFRAWSRKIAHYQVLTYRKRQGRERVRFSQKTMDALGVEARKSEIQLSLRHYALQKCLEKISFSHRKLILLCYSEEEHTLRDVAETLDQTYDAVRKKLLRVRRALATCVDRTLQTGGQV